MFRQKLTYSNVVSSLCLFLLVAGGGAYAAGKLKANSVGTKQIKKDAVNGSKVADGSLSGADIGGPVNHAATADQLAGSPPSAFVPSSAVKRFDFAPTGCSSGEPQCSADIISFEGLVVRASCTGSGAGDFRLTVAAAPAGVNLSLEGVNVATPFAADFVPSLNQIVFEMQTMAGSRVGGGTMVIRSAAHTQTIVFGGKLSYSGVSDCHAFGTVLSA
jgi:hypothetical protein